MRGSPAMASDARRHPTSQSINRGQPGDGSGPLQQPSPAMPGAKQGGTKERRAAAGSEVSRSGVRGASAPSTTADGKR